LHNEDVLAPDILLDLDEGFPIGKRAEPALAKLDADFFAQSLGQGLIGCAAEDFHAGRILQVAFTSCLSFKKENKNPPPKVENAITEKRPAL
jgi:hypothetical protein